MGNFVHDVRFGVRMLAKHPGLSIISVLTFGVGLGITTFVFSIVNGIFFSGLPFPDGERIVRLGGANPSRGLWKMQLSERDFEAYREGVSSFEAMGAWSVEPVNLAADNGAPERITGAQTTPGIFRSLGVPAVLGRTIQVGDDNPGAEPVVVLGHRIWRDRFGSSPAVLGKIVRVNAEKRTVVGVMPEGFGFPELQQVWTPLEIHPAGKERFLSVIGRLRAGVSIREANAQAEAVAARIAKEFPDTNEQLTAWVKTYPESMIAPQIYALMSTMFAAGVGVLLIACANVGNLVLARTSLRQREVAVRMALGAGRARIISQFLAESALLASAGGIIGLALTEAALAWFRQTIAAEPPPFFITFDIDYRVLGYVLAAVAASTLVAGLLPALRATGRDSGDALKDESRGSTGLKVGKLSSVLIVAEVALSCGLLIGAGLMIRSIVQLRTVPMPFAVERILTGRINLPGATYPGHASCIRFYERLLPKLEGIPGVEAATLADGLPASGNSGVPVQIEGHAYSRPEDCPSALEGIVMPGYFRTFEVDLRGGREFTNFDRIDAPYVAVVNESFAKEHFRGGDPLGRRIRTGSDGKGPWRTVVGVVPDLLMQGMKNDQTSAGYYIPLAQSEVTNYVAVAVRTSGDPLAASGALRAAVASIDQDLPVYQVMPMRDMIDRLTWFYRIFGSLFMAFGCVALLLAVAGLYGVMSFSVTQRSHEMWIRSALGAPSGGLILLMMRRGLIHLALGLLVGLSIGSAATAPLSLILYRVHPRDPLVLFAVPLILAAAGLIATLMPALRGSRMNTETTRKLHGAL
jgi:putative ABC transport system permease protein